MRSSSNLALSTIIFALLAPFPVSAFADDNCARWIVTHPNDSTTVIQCAPDQLLEVVPAPTSHVRHAIVIPHNHPHQQLPRMEHHARHQGSKSLGDILSEIFRPHPSR